jgi:Cu(I)/Ag(I) efflux system protein CusF
MKHTATLTLLVALALGASSSFAADKMGDMKGMGMGGQNATPSTQQTTHKAVGVVKDVDPKAGMVTFAHEPVKSLNWSAMTMGFAVKDKALLDKLSVGKKVEFELRVGRES